MIWLILLRTTTLTYATYGVLRARLRPAFALIVPTIAMIVLPTMVVLDPTSAIASAVMAAPWALPLGAALTGAMVTRSAFAALDRERAGSVRASALETAGYALLGEHPDRRCAVRDRRHCSRALGAKRVRALMKRTVNDRCMGRAKRATSQPIWVRPTE